MMELQGIYCDIYVYIVWYRLDCILLTANNNNNNAPT